VPRVAQLYIRYLIGPSGRGPQSRIRRVSSVKPFGLVLWNHSPTCGTLRLVANAIVNIRSFGAAGDGLSLDTYAIQSAIDAAQAGDTVQFPAGTYLSYSIRLKSHLTIQLDRGATLLAAGDPPPSHESIVALLSADGTLPGGGTGDAGSFYAGDSFGSDDITPPLNPPAAKPASAKPISFAEAFAKGTVEKLGTRNAKSEAGYDLPEPNPHDKYQDHGHSHWHNSLIWGENLEHVAITGPGTIDGRGLTWNAAPANPTGNKAIALKCCRHVTLRDFTIFRGGHFALLATGCQDMTIAGLTLDTNRDGLDIDSCQRVIITKCRVNSPNDDGIVLKSSYALGAAMATEDVLIDDCHLSGFDLGTLIDGTRQKTQKIAPDRGGVTGRIKLGTESNGGFKNITIRDCTFAHCRGLALETVDGGPMENIAVERLTMRDLTSAPLFIRLGNRARGPSGMPVATVRNIRISDVTATDVEPRFACLFVGIPGHCIEGLTLENIRITYRGGGGLADAAAQPAEKKNAYPEPNMFGVIPAYGLFCRHVRNLRVHNFNVSTLAPDKRPPIVLDDVHDAHFTAISAQTHDTPLSVQRNSSEIQGM
jgi:polygalacturonase